MAFGVFSLVIAVCIGDLKKKDFLYNVTRIALLCVLFINIVFSVVYTAADVYEANEYFQLAPIHVLIIDNPTYREIQQIEFLIFFLCHNNRQ